MDQSGRNFGDDRDRQDRAEALRALARQRGASEPSELAPAASTPGVALLGQPRGERGAAPSQRRWLVAGLILVVVIAIVAVTVGRGILQAPTRQAAIPALVTLDPATFNVNCIQDAAWSPDSSMIAILGAQPDCASSDPQNYAYFPTVITIVNATTGKVVHQFQPDSFVQQTLRLGAPQGITPEQVDGMPDNTKQVIDYQSIAWSPDGKRLALPFWVSVAAASPGQKATGKLLRGAYLATPDGSDQQAFARDATSDTSGVGYSGEWNVKAGQYVPAKTGSTPDPNDSAALAPLATTYTWNSDGSLTGAGRLTTTGPKGPVAVPEPVGNPIGGRTFSIWQPMGVFTDNLASQPNTSNTQTTVYPPVIVAQTSILAWSPDGTYLLQAYASGIRLQPAEQPEPGPQQLAQTGLAKAPVLPLHDRALNALLDKPAVTPHNPQAPGGQFAWSPDGKLLATITVDSGPQNEGSERAVIYDTATGRVLQSTKVTFTSNVNGNLENVPFRWSPDGSRLLVSFNGGLFSIHVTAHPTSR